MEKIQEDREICRMPVKGPRPKVEPIFTILFVITKCAVHGGKKMDCLHSRERSFNASVLSEIGKHLYADFHIPTPAITPPLHLPVPDAILLQKARRHIRGKFISQFLSARKFDEVFPDCPIPIPRSPAVAQPLDLDHRVSDKSPQLQVSRSWILGLFHDEPP
jgi:hypothetical protein